MTQQSTLKKMLIVPVQSFQVGDHVFPTLQEAERHVARKLLRDLLDEGGICKGGEWSSDMVFEWLVRNADEIGNCLWTIRGEIKG